MVPVTLNFDGKDPDKAYVAKAKKNPDGSLVTVSGNPVIEDWIEVIPTLITPPTLPATCKPDPDSGGGGSGGEGGGEGALALILLLILALLYFSRK